MAKETKTTAAAPVVPEVPAVTTTDTDATNQEVTAPVVNVDAVNPVATGTVTTSEQPTVTPSAQPAIASTPDKVFLTNKIKAPIHIKARTEVGDVFTVTIAPHEVKEFDRNVLKLRGVEQFIQQGKLKVVDSAAASYLTKEHAGILTSADE
ncbi:hypothetical protein [Kosakonia sacchari]|uniref:hypothetical protein n=1 Tax=Kosakonia sacchari TaxID=1158459 RepID=UPI001584645C|nr:hypothetical protein [Kosakonia sacchari]NUL35049.1 hypothetical protein [Kosakonia sacchari]